MTCALAWFDEFAFLKFNNVVYAAASPALSKAMESAKKNKTPYGKLVTTTPRALGIIVAILLMYFFNCWKNLFN